MAAAIPRLATGRLVLEVLEPEEAPRVVRFFARNEAHLAPWEPPRSAGFLTDDFWRERLARNRLEAMNDQSLRFFLVEGAEVVGTLNLTNFMRGPFQACFLGYSIDRDHEGRGFMSEALRAAVGHVWKELRLHRIMANHLPENVRSARLLRKLGFVVEGYARDYLYIAGAWRDHVLTALTNPDPCSPPG